MATFISGGFLKPLLLTGKHNFITGGSPGGSITYVGFITSLGNTFKTSDGENFKVKQ